MLRPPSATATASPHPFADQATLPWTPGGDVTREMQLGYANRGLQPNAKPVDLGSSAATGSFWSKYLCMPPSKPVPHPYAADTQGSFIGRVASVASHSLLTRNEAGQTRINATYVLGVLSTAAVHASNRPFWARSTRGHSTISVPPSAATRA